MSSEGDEGLHLTCGLNPRSLLSPGPLSELPASLALTQVRVRGDHSAHCGQFLLGLHIARAAVTITGKGGEELSASS